MSPIVAARLDSLALRHQAQPILLTFQEPSVIYAMGRPVPTIHTWPELFEQLDRNGQVVTVALPIESKVLQVHPKVDVEILENFKGFNLTKGDEQTLHFLLIRPKKKELAIEITERTEKDKGREIR
jgi:hypothetical protein